MLPLMLPRGATTSGIREVPGPRPDPTASRRGVDSGNRRHTAKSDRSAPMRILLVDDHSMVRSGLRLLLEEQDDFDVVGEAGDVEAALERTRALEPNVILLDLNMPGRPSLPAIPELLEAAPGSAVVVMTQHDDPEFARVALAGGASGFVLKEAADSELVDSVRAAAAGRTYVDPSLGARLAAGPASPPAEADAGGRAARRLDASPVTAFDAVAGQGRDGRRLPRDGHGARSAGRAEGARAQPRRATACSARASSASAASPRRWITRTSSRSSTRARSAGALYLTMRFVEGDRSPGAARARSSGSSHARAVEHRRAGRCGAGPRRTRRGLVHRDVKPANVLIATRDGERAGLPHRLRDHDGAQRTASSLTKTGFAVGHGRLHVARSRPAGRKSTPAPTSTHSAACSYRALTGAVLYDKDSDVEKMWAHIHEPPPDLLDVRPELPASLGDVVERALAKIPADRQQTAGELAHELLAAVVGA